MRTMRRNFRHLIIAVFIMFLAIGFAAFSATLKINGTYTIGSMSWDVHFENVDVTQGSVTANPAPTTNNIDTTEMTYTINFTKPGDFYEFTVDIVNNGNIDAMVDTLSNNAYTSINGTEVVMIPNYLIMTTEYTNGTKIHKNQLLISGTSAKIKVRIEFKKNISAEDLPEADRTLYFKLKANYVQSDENAYYAEPMEEFTWNRIVSDIRAGKGMYYKLGDTKKIEMDLDNNGVPEEYTLRLINNTTPKKCSENDFSQTACGFVLEFENIITTHRMNLGGNTSTNGRNNKGGWEYSDMRAYLNSTTYTEGNVDYSESGIYNALPTDLKNNIIDTKVVSGYGINDTKVFVTTDKLYLLSIKEITNSNGDYDNAYNKTRQLDYYSQLVEYTSRAKKYNNSNTEWWTRTPVRTGSNFYYITTSGDFSSYSYSASTANGVSPAFRIG